FTFDHDSLNFRLCLTAFLALLCATQAASKSTGEHHNEHPRRHLQNIAQSSIPQRGRRLANILKAFKDCATDSVITFLPANYSAFTPITLAGLNNVVVHLNGNLLLPNNITKIQQEMNVTTNPPNQFATPWFYIYGSNVQLIGSTDFEWGRFYGFGQQWWDLGITTLRPQLAVFNVIKPVAWGWFLPGANLRVENHYMDAKPDNGTRLDTVVCGINISGQNVTVDGYGFYGLNGDDCISVVNGGRNVFATNGFCGFSSHGLSIGSLGSKGSFQTVQGVVFKNWTMDGAVYGARFKSWTGGAGFADNVTWEDITLVNVSTAIFLTQNLGPPPNTTSNSSTKISNFKYNNFKGSLNVNWSAVLEFRPGGDATQSIIFDLYPETALNVSPANETTVICDPTTLVPGEQATLGFNCTRGPYVPTPIV
ncbi:pectin lyase fold/virulence factor, partial [Mycena leptocephala]